MEHIFYMRLNNDVCSAQVTEVENLFQTQYHVLFGDGYQNIFFTDVESGAWIEEDLGETDLAVSFGKRIFQVDGPQEISGKSLTWCRAAYARQLMCFGFHTYRKQGKNYFEIYADNRKFLFTLVYVKKKWTVLQADGKPGSLRHGQVALYIAIFRGLADHL